MDLIALIILLALIEYIVLVLRVGAARIKSGIKAPAVVGDEVFERHFRIQYNTLEQLILFVPGIWFFAQFVHVYWAAGLGAVYIVGRAIYAMLYIRDPETRAAGALLSAVPCWILVLGAFAGVAWRMMN